MIKENRIYKEKIEDYEIMQDQIEKADKELISFKYKITQMSANLEEQLMLRDNHAKQLTQIIQLTGDLKAIQIEKKEYFVEMKRLNRIEEEYNNINKKLESTEKELSTVIEENMKFVNEIQMLKNEKNKFKKDYDEQLDTLLNNQISNLFESNVQISNSNPTIEDKKLIDSTNNNLTLELFEYSSQINEYKVCILKLKETNEKMKNELEIKCKQIKDSNSNSNQSFQLIENQKLKSKNKILITEFLELTKNYQYLQFQLKSAEDF